jgi:hypothetical protein
MLRRSRRMLHFGGGSTYGTTSGGSLGYTGGLGAHGNMYQGRVNPDDHQPRGFGSRIPKGLYEHEQVYADDDPVIKAKLERCPYFALCDMCVWQGMAPTFLDPGLLTQEEHHLLLLFSRAYYEKWREIHSAPREFVPRARKKLGRFTKCVQIFEYLKIDLPRIRKAQELYFDDATLMGFHPRLWVTAHLDEQLRDQITGRVLRQAGFVDDEVNKVFGIVDSMRTLYVIREDVPNTADVIVPYREAITLYDLYARLGIDGSRAIKCHNYKADGMPARCITISGEDDFFDFLVDNFYESDPAIAETNSAARLVLRVDAKTRIEAGTGTGIWV